MNKLYFEEFRRRVTDDAPYAVFHRNDINYVAHIHEEVEVAFVCSGVIRAVGETKESELSAGDMYVFMPDEIHALSTVAPNQVYILRILPKQNDRINFSLLRLSDNVLRPGDAGYDALRRSVLQMVQEDESHPEGWEMAMRKCRYEIFLTILRELKYTVIRTEEKKRLANRTMLLRRVNDYIEEHFSEPISLDEISSACGYSKYYFAHCIRQITGVTFLEFLMLYRLNAARARIRDTEDTITEIALSCGFNNLRSFHRIFRKHYRMTPLEYRKEGEKPFKPEDTET